eukprot:820312-Amphidinium_carterae.1
MSFRRLFEVANPPKFAPPPPPQSSKNNQVQTQAAMRYEVQKIFWGGGGGGTLFGSKYGASSVLQLSDSNRETCGPLFLNMLC